MMTNPSWWRALTLRERLAAGRPEGSSDVESPATAERRLQEWRSRRPFRNDEWFLRRLSLDGLDEAGFRLLLGESEETLRDRVREIPPWLQRLEQVLAEHRPDHPKGQLPVFGPLIARAFDHLTGTARALALAHPEVPFDPDGVAEQITANITVRVDWRISRAIVLEMRVADLKGDLPGEDAAARFQGFLQRLQEPQAALSFMQEYPVLARLVVESIDAWTEAGAELLHRLCADWETIVETFWPERDCGRLEKVEIGLGDLHRQGRSVCSLHFSGGDRLLYKPRSLRIDLHFAELLRWLSARGAPTFRSPLTLDRGEHGWSEFVPHAPCLSHGEACRFYERQGALLAVFYVLNANDFHRENLVAAGEFPVPVDLETLCGPDYGQASEDTYDSKAEYEFRNSVASIMLLPYVQEGEGRRIIDLSGLGGRGGQTSINPIPQWENLGTDEIRLSFERREIRETPNRPTLDGQRLSAFDFSAEIERGFVSTYGALLAYRAELLAEAGPLAAMRDDEVRIVFRATELYETIINQSGHPDYLGDGLERERLFDRLWFGIDRTLFPQVCLRLLPHERQDLWLGEIPDFTARVASTDVWTSRGARLEDFFARSGFEMSRARIEQLSAADLQRQIWYIRGSLTALALNRGQSFERYTPAIDPPPAGRERLLAHASAIADRVTELAQWKQGCASWVGLAFGESYGWHLRPLQTDLYSGLPGIALFLAYAGAMTGRGELRGVAEATLATLRRQMKRRRAGLEFVGGFDGWGGLLYLWLHLAHLWQDDSLLGEAERMLARIDEVARSDRQMDVMQGNAGAIVPLLSLHKMTGSPAALDLADRLGDRLLQLARPYDGGMGWLGAQYPDHPMTGFSHGSSGFAWALAELFAATGKGAFAEMALAAVRFERSHFSREAENWEDLRTSEGKKTMAAWCHGACGVGLSRICMQPHLEDEVIREDLRAAVRTTYRQGFGSNHSLCHGDLGSLELLLQASRCLPREEWGGRLAERTAQTVASIEEKGWLCGVPLDVETPGLMEGLAGIGFGLLRLAEPARVPAVLILQGPERLEEGAHYVNPIFEGVSHERIVGTGQGREPGNPVGFPGSAVAGHS
jgi:type 2 lantibiotic biosynthesis protein LanM